jgi:hypothetical protein
MSKTQKNGTCKHKFTQGPKKGQLCKKSCRTQFCKNHNKNKKAYLKNYYQKKKEVERDYKLNQLLKKIKGITDIDKLPELQKYELKLKTLQDDHFFLIKKKLGVRKVIGFDDKVIIDKLDGYINPIPDHIKEEAKGNESFINWYMNAYPKKPVIFEFKGSETQAKRKLKKLEPQIELNIDKIRQYRKIIDTIKQQQDKLN